MYEVSASVAFCCKICELRTSVTLWHSHNHWASVGTYLHLLDRKFIQKVRSMNACDATEQFVVLTMAWLAPMAAQSASSKLAKNNTTRTQKPVISIGFTDKAQFGNCSDFEEWLELRDGQTDRRMKKRRGRSGAGGNLQSCNWLGIYMNEWFARTGLSEGPCVHVACATTTRPQAKSRGIYAHLGSRTSPQNRTDS